MLTKLNRYFAKMFEDADNKVRRMRASGQNVLHDISNFSETIRITSPVNIMKQNIPVFLFSQITQFNMILNLEGYNLAQHACLQCKLVHTYTRVHSYHFIFSQCPQFKFFLIFTILLLLIIQVCHFTRRSPKHWSAIIQERPNKC